MIFARADEIPEGVLLVSGRESALRELFTIRNPRLKHSPDFEEQCDTFIKTSAIASVYVYYPWLNKAVETLPETEYFELRTARNKNIISADDQGKYRSGHIGIAGLSVGSSALHAVVMTGGPRSIKIADFDVVETTNLNRIRAGLPNIGESKTDVAARLAWELDPFAEIELYREGITEANIDAFVTSSRLDVVIDAMEAIDQKVALRFAAKREKIPVIMATDNGDGIVLDVERFDLEPERPIFHGLIPFSDPHELKNLSPREWLHIASLIVDPEHLSDSMRESIIAVGNTLPSVPQLGSSAMLAGSTVAYAVRRILTEKSMPSGRYAYTFEELLDSAYSSPERAAERKTSGAAFLERIKNG